MFSEAIRSRATELVHELIRQNLSIVTAESCTGGLISGALTSVAGSSEVVFGGFVTYANEAKMRMIGVPEAVLDTHGAVSEATARAMAEGARKASKADVSIAVTGIAGPGGGSPEKPVGLVHFACATGAGTVHREELFGDIGREEVREATVAAALELVRTALL